MTLAHSLSLSHSLSHSHSHSLSHSPLALALALALALPSLAHAQTVAVHDLTVDGNPPPDEYRQQLDAAIATSLVPIRGCYASALATHPGLHGDLRLRLWVSARQVIRVTPETSVGDAALETCAHDRVHEFTLPPQAPEGGAQVRFTMTFTPPAGGAAITPPPTTTAPPPTSIVTPPTSIVTPVPTPATTGAAHVAIDRSRGALSTETMTYVIDHAGFAQCTTSAHGTVPIHVTVNAAGHATAHAGRGTLRDAAYQTCVVARLTAATWPPASATTHARVTLTLP